MLITAHDFQQSWSSMRRAQYWKNNIVARDPMMQFRDSSDGKTANLGSEELADGILAWKCSIKLNLRDFM